MDAPRTSLQSPACPSEIWDVHHHIFEPSKFAYSENRHLTPPPATVQQFLEFKQKVGVTHSVLTHGLSYGSDCTSLLAFLNEIGGGIKGIGVIDPSTTTDDEIHRMHQVGVRGIRVNLYRYQAMHSLERQQVALREHARRIRCQPGWTMTMTHTHPEYWSQLRPVIQNELVPAGVRLITDHFALLKGSSMLPSLTAVHEQEGFDAIVSLIRDGLLWIKLSAPYRVSEDSPDFLDLRPLVKAFAEANPRRILWGSDWPHTPRMKVRDHAEALKETPYLNVDDAAWLRSLRSWLSDEQWECMMVHNPKELYDW